jgi:hypothetical protein
VWIPPNYDDEQYERPVFIAETERGRKRKTKKQREEKRRVDGWSESETPGTHPVCIHAITSNMGRLEVGPSFTMPCAHTNNVTGGGIVAVPATGVEMVNAGMVAWSVPSGRRRKGL